VNKVYVPDVPNTLPYVQSGPLLVGLQLSVKLAMSICSRVSANTPVVVVSESALVVSFANDCVNNGVVFMNVLVFVVVCACPRVCEHGLHMVNDVDVDYSYLGQQ
jgi:hypothetical protein